MSNKKPNRKRDKRITIRGTPEEKAKIEEKAKEAGLSRNEYMLKSALEKDITSLDNLESINNLRLELKRIGNNLNQIARNLNENNTLDQEEKILLIEEIDDLKAQQAMIHREILKLL